MIEIDFKKLVKNERLQYEVYFLFGNHNTENNIIGISPESIAVTSDLLWIRIQKNVTKDYINRDRDNHIYNSLRMLIEDLRININVIDLDSNEYKNKINLIVRKKRPIRNLKINPDEPNIEKYEIEFDVIENL